MKGEKMILRSDNLLIRPFSEDDIQAKVSIINDSSNNQFLHYDLPLNYSKTLNWFRNLNTKTDRVDCTILFEDQVCGFIGLLNIDQIRRQAEYYICIDHHFSGKGIGVKASKMLFDYAFKTLKLDKIYLYTEEENQKAQYLFKKLGFVEKGLIKNHLFYDGKSINRYLYELDGSGEKINTPIDKIRDKRNNIFIKREDLIGFSFGGNKARKSIKFKDDIIRKGSDIIITYGSSSSNHCRVIANMSKSMGLRCIIISPEEDYRENNNSQLVKLLGAEVIKVPVDKVSDTINAKISELSAQNKPYFIPGGGHGNLGVQAYVDCYNEIVDYEKKNNIHFDYIFLASGTGSTQAGLICGQYLNKDFGRKIIGISIARAEERGAQVVISSVQEFLGEDTDKFKNLVIFKDDYILSGYGAYNNEVLETIRSMLFNEGISLNAIYTGKAFYGMQDYLKRNNIIGKNILFINTGGLPLFFNNLKELI